MANEAPETPVIPAFPGKDPQSDPASPEWRFPDQRTVLGQVGGDAMKPAPGAEIDPAALAEKLAAEWQAAHLEETGTTPPLPQTPE